MISIPFTKKPRTVGRTGACSAARIVASAARRSAARIVAVTSGAGRTIGCSAYRTAAPSAARAAAVASAPGRTAASKRAPRFATTILFLVILSAFTIGSAVAQTRPDALVLYRQGQYERAVDVTLAELDEEPGNLDAYTVLGWSLLALGRYEDALQYGQRGLDVSRFDHRIVHIVGEANYQLGNNIDALQYLQNYAALAPRGTLIDEVYYLMGEIHIRLEEYHHADIALTTAVFLDDTRGRWWARLGYAREMAGSENFALEAYRSALERNPNLIEAQRGVDRLSA